MLPTAARITLMTHGTATPTATRTAQTTAQPDSTSARAAVLLSQRPWLGRLRPVTSGLPVQFRSAADPGGLERNLRVVQPRPAIFAASGIREMPHGVPPATACPPSRHPQDMPSACRNPCGGEQVVPVHSPMRPGHTSCLVA